MSRRRKPNRSHGNIDKLPPELREEVDILLATDATYQQVVDLVASNGYQTSKSSVHRYAAKLGALVDDLRRSRQVMRVVADEMARHPGIDGSAAILSLTEQQLFAAVSALDSSSWEGVPAVKIAQQATACIRASNSKRKIDAELATDTDKAVAAQGGILFDALRRHPELYAQLMDVIKEEAGNHA